MLTELNKHSTNRIDDYINLRVHGKSVRCPYYINDVGAMVDELMEKADIPHKLAKKAHEVYKNREVPYGWYRGKGTPEELAGAVVSISEERGPSLENASSEGIRDFMQLYGLGVDCSGFVFHVLSTAFKKIGMLDDFVNSLSWENNDKRGADYAGAFVFAAKASTELDPKDAQALDLVLITSGSEYTHVALVVEKDGGLMLAQSNIDSDPNGVTLSDVNVTNNGLHFSYKPQIAADWNTYFDKGVIEIRRLKLVV